MTEIKIKIDCNGELCGDCRMMIHDDYGNTYCSIFDENADFDFEKTKRPAECLDATIENNPKTD